jgi:E3 Ubiquitin ligase
VRGLDRAVPDHAAFLAALARARRTAPGQARAGETVLLTGSAQPGPDGVLRAPVSGLPCVWFRVLEVAGAPFTLSVHPQMPPTVTSDGAYPSSFLIPRRDDESPARFAVADGTGAGSVEVDPALIDLYTDFVPVDAQGGSYDSGYTHLREWILPPGTPVFVCGTVGPDQVLRAQPGTPLIVSTRGEQAAVQRARTLTGAGVGPRYLSQARARGRGVAVGVCVGVALLAVLVAVLVVLVS